MPSKPKASSSSSKYDTSKKSKRSEASEDVQIEEAVLIAEARESSPRSTPSKKSKKNVEKDEKRDVDEDENRFVGQLVPEDEARQRWPHRYRGKKKEKGIDGSKSVKGKDESEEIIQARRHFTRAEIDGRVIFNLEDDAHVKRCKDGDVSSIRGSLVWGLPAQFPPQFQCLSHQPSQSQRPSRQNKLNWSIKEDEVLCKAWTMIGKDPVMGLDQHKSTYWERIQINFQSQLGGMTERNSSGLMNRFSYLHPIVNKFSECYKTVQDTSMSDFKVEDLIQIAKALYKKQESVDFKLGHCWNILRNSAKWHSHCNAQQGKQKPNQQIRKRGVVDLDINELENCSEKVSTTLDSFQNNPSTPSPLGVSTPRVLTPALVNFGHDDSPADTDGSHEPLGRKAMTNGNNKNKSVLQMKKLFVTEVQDFKEQDCMVNEAGLEGVRLKIQAKIEISLAQERTKQLEIESRERIAKYENERVQVEFERDIMCQDPNKAPTKEAKAWIIAQQKAILNKFNQGSGHM